MSGKSIRMTALTAAVLLTLGACSHPYGSKEIGGRTTGTATLFPRTSTSQTESTVTGTEEETTITDTTYREPTYVTETTPAKTVPPETEPPPTEPAPTTPQRYEGAITVRTPQASGTVTYAENGAVIDASHTADGYIMVKCTGASGRLKVRVAYGGGELYYDLNAAGNYEVFPLQMGDGGYQVTVFEQGGKGYVPLCSAELSVSLTSDFSPFLYPNQYVDFSAASQAVRKSYDLSVGASSDIEKVQAIYEYVIGSISYDTAKASGVASGYLPDVDSTLAEGKGICFDYAALLAAMLRAQDIPAKLVIGTVAPNGLSHSWNMVYTQSSGWIAVGLYFDGGVWKRMDPTFAASKGGGMEQFIGNGSNYTELRFY